MRALTAVFLAGLLMAGSPASVAPAADLQLDMQNGTIRTFRGVRLHRATTEKGTGLKLHLSLGAGRAFPVPASRIRALSFTPEEQDVPFRLLLDGGNGSFREVPTVKLVSFSEGAFKAYGAGSAKPYDLPLARVINLSPEREEPAAEPDPWQAQISAQAFLSNRAKPVAPPDAQKRKSLDTRVAKFSAIEAPQESEFVVRDPKGLLGKPFPEKQLVGAAGEPIGFSVLQAGKPTVVLVMRGFAGYVCPGCTAQTAALVKQLPEFDSLGARVMMIYPGPAETLPAFLEAVRHYQQHEALPFPVFYDVDLSVVTAFGAQGTLANPTSIVVDRDGTVRYVYVGSNPFDRPPVGALLYQVRKLSETG